MKMEISTVNSSSVTGQAWRDLPVMGVTLALLHTQLLVDGRGQLAGLWKSQVDKSDCMSFTGSTGSAAVSIKLGILLGGNTGPLPHQ